MKNKYSLNSSKTSIALERNVKNHYTHGDDTNNYWSKNKWDFIQRHTNDFNHNLVFVEDPYDIVYFYYTKIPDLSLL